MTYFRAVDPLPLESSDHNKLAEFYRRLGEGRLVTTRCAGCAHRGWSPCHCDRRRSPNLEK